jgi:hypothetical protein
MTQRNPKGTFRKAPVGTRYGSFTVISYAGQNEHRQATWLCRCDCGREKARVAWKVANGGITKCIHCSAREIGDRRKVNTARDTSIIAAASAGISHREIAKDIGLSPGGVSAAIDRAKRKGIFPLRREA